MTDRKPRTDAGRRDAMQELLRACASDVFETGRCPSESELAAFLEGTLTADQRSRIERHLAGCEPCFGAMEATLDARLEAPAPRGLLRRLPRWLRRPTSLVAATVMLAVGVGILLWSVSGPDPERSGQSPDSDPGLVAVVASLGQEHPEIFGGFKPILGRERRDARLPRVRGDGVALISPRATLIETRPAFAWSAAAGSTPISIELMNNDLEPIWQRSVSGSPFPYPPDASPLDLGAEYVWRLVYATPFSERETAVATFRCANPRDRAAHSRALEIIAASVSAPTHHLVSAHYAARNDLLMVACSHARAFASARADSLPGRETLRYVLVLLRSPEADRVWSGDSNR